MNARRSRTHTVATQMLENIPPATVTSKITAATPVGRLCHPKTSPVARNGRLVAEPPMEP